MKILLIRIFGVGGGAEKSVNNLLKYAELKNSKHVIFIDLCFSDFMLSCNGANKLTSIIKFIYKIRYEAKDSYFLLSCLEGLPFLLLKIATIGIRTPKAMWLHCEPIGYSKFINLKQRFYIKISIILAKNIICASPWYSRLLSKKSSKNILFLPNFTDGLDNNISSESLFNSYSNKNFLYVGSLTKLKNLSACLNFIHKLNELYKAEFVIYGNGDNKDLLENEIKILELGKQVKFQGYRDINWSIYAAKSILLIPSCTEALPMVAMEAISHGIPVIINKFRGYQYFSKHNGLVFAADFNYQKSIIDSSIYINNISNDEYENRKFNTQIFLNKNFNNKENFKKFIKYIELIDGNT